MALKLCTFGRFCSRIACVFLWGGGLPSQTSLRPVFVPLVFVRLLTPCRAPVMKWALVIAGISDLARPAEKLSVTQNVALTATGLIWTRWCLIIKPRNVMLAAANFFLGVAGMVQCVRIYLARSGGQTPEPLAEAVETVKEAVKEVKQ